jgi:hypothetical protein
MAALSTSLGSHAEAATRVYLMRGLGGLLLSNSMDQVAARLNNEHRGVIAVAGHWESWQYFANEAAQHPHDKLVFGGHSMGAAGAVWAANYLKARGITVHVVGLDPLCTFPRLAKGIPAVSYYANGCYGQAGVIVGARNIYVGPYAHITIGSHVEVQNRMIASILRN